MGRKSRRELESDLESLTVEESHPDGDRMLVHEDPETGEWYEDRDLSVGPLDKDSTDPLVVLQETVVETGWGQE